MAAVQGLKLFLIASQSKCNRSDESFLSETRINFAPFSSQTMNRMMVLNITLWFAVSTTPTLWYFSRS